MLSRHWLRTAWANKYCYTFTWLDRPVIQFPEDLMRLQEVIVDLRPDVIVETGIAHGGSLVFFASLCHLLGTGRVIGVDVEIRPHNRAALDAQPASADAQESLFDAMRSKVALLQQTVELINEMRKGNQAEAGRLIRGLNQ